MCRWSERTGECRGWNECKVVNVGSLFYNVSKNATSCATLIGIEEEGNVKGNDSGGRRRRGDRRIWKGGGRKYGNVQDMVRSHPNMHMTCQFSHG